MGATVRSHHAQWEAGQGSKGTVGDRMTGMEKESCMLEESREMAPLEGFD